MDIDWNEINEEAEAYGYRNIQAIDFENLVAEESYGSNIDK